MDFGRVDLHNRHKNMDVYTILRRKSHVGDQVQLQSMNAAQLTKKILNGEPLFILDVRTESDFHDWKIEGNRVRVVNKPYFDLIDGVDQILDWIPDDHEVLVVCAKEGSSRFVAEQLIEAGKQHIAYLVGGMESWSEHLEPVKIADLDAGGEILQFVRIGKGCLSYMVISNGEAAIVDAVRMTEVFTDYAKEKNVKIKHTIDTHLHADHISGGRELAAQTGGTYWLPPKDAVEVTFDYEKLEEDTSISVGHTEIKIQPLYSPGHTIGSTSLILNNQYLLSGDILFVKSIGRPDLAGQAEDWVADLRSTLYERYKQLPEDLIVLPAHFGKFTELGEGGQVSARLGDLFKENQGLNIKDDSTFRRTVTDHLPPQPHAYQEIRQTNMGKITPTEKERREMEIGPNRCAVHDA
jgi:glyoxylase-like metal-dependent hydrolase (beta-lactamase superfamily II)/rhodanese-related sulfurtransferase